MLERLPAQLSGGQRQRVALGRAIVRDPRAFLFDEPLSNLDPRLRGETRAELIELHGRLRTTMVYVTHDQEEAMTLGQRVAVLHEGRIEQVDAPARLYNQPATIFVAQFIGSPPMNLIEPDRLTPESGIDLPSGAALLGLRPHDVRLMPQPALLAGVVQLVESLGATQIVHVRTDRGRVIAVVSPELAFSPGRRCPHRSRPRQAALLRFERPEALKHRPTENNDGFLTVLQPQISRISLQLAVGHG